MADCAQNILNKYNDEDLAELPTRRYAIHNLVNLRDTCQFSKSLVDWYKGDQEYSQTPEAPASRICAEYPSHVNTKVHLLSNFFPNPHRPKKKRPTDRSRTNAKRNNGLSFFVEDLEQLKKNIEEPLQLENKQKAQSQSNTAIPTATGKFFTNIGSRIVFNFKHFADPEEVVLEYINVHIYNRVRLGRVDKKKVSASVIALHNIQKEESAGLNKTEADKSLNVICADESYLHNEKSSTNVLRLEKRLPTIKILERAMATNNLIFEFDPLDALNSHNGRNSHMTLYGGRTDLQPDSNAGPALFTTANRNPKLRSKRSGASLLPKLNSTELRLSNVENAEINIFFRKTVLPDIPRGKNSNRKKKETRDSTANRKKQSPDIDVQAANVTSNWQLLKQKRNWTQGKNSTNSLRTLQLYDTLEKMTSEIYKRKNSYSELETNDCLHKSGYKSLKEVTRYNHDKEPGRSREVLLPERKIRGHNKEIMSLKYSDEKIQGPDNFGKNLLKSDEKSSITKVSMKSTGNDKSRSKLNVGTENFEKKQMLKCKRELESTSSKSEVEKYLDKYSVRLDRKLTDGRHEKTISYPSSDVVADMLARLNIYDVGFHIDAEKKKASINTVNSPGKSEEFTQTLLSETSNTPMICPSAAKTEAKLSATIETTGQNNNISNKGVHQSYELKDVVKICAGIQPDLIKGDGRKLCTVEQGSGTIQTDKIAIRNSSNTFVKMGLNGLGGQIPKHLCPQILRSDFLKKDLSFKRGVFFRNSLNFKNTPNSGGKLTFSIDNAGSQCSSQCDSWLQKKIESIIASGCGASSIAGEEASRMIKKLKFENDCVKLREIVNIKLSKGQGEKKFMEMAKQTFAQKFLKVQEEILLNPRLQAILPRLVEGLSNFSKTQTR